MYASILYLIFKIYYDKLSKSRRCGGMADAADSKSAGGYNRQMYGKYLASFLI